MTNPWQILSASEIYDNPWIHLTEYAVINPNGGKGIYGKIHFKNRAIGILPIDGDGNIILIGQYRFPIEQYSWELPEGGALYNEDPLDGAKRELAEEAKLQAEKWQLLSESYLSNSVTDEHCLIYLATELSPAFAEQDDTEDLVVKKVSIEEALQMVLSNEITDVITQVAILKWKALQK